MSQQAKDRLNPARLMPLVSRMPRGHCDAPVTHKPLADSGKVVRNA